MAVKILANENIPLKSIQIIRNHGFDIKSIGIDHPSISDQEVIQIAKDEERLIITFDSDYGDLIFKYGYKPVEGVIYFRIHKIDHKTFANTVINLLSEKTLVLKYKLTVYDGVRLRQRSYHENV